MDFRELEKKYSSDAGFNKMVNLFTQLINEYQFMPSELREGLFLAQYKYETNHPTQIIRTQKDWDNIHEARVLMRTMFTEGIK